MKHGDADADQSDSGNAKSVSDNSRPTLHGPVSLWLVTTYSRPGQRTSRKQFTATGRRWVLTSGARAPDKVPQTHRAARLDRHRARKTMAGYPTVDVWE